MAEPITIIVASRNRPNDVERLVLRLSVQSLPPRRIILVGAETDDIPQGLGCLLPESECHVVLTTAGSCRQRNAGLDALDALNAESGFVVFFDDDYVPSRFALEDMAATFLRHPDVVGLNGRVLADGIGSGGIETAEAADLVDRYDESRSPGTTVSAVVSTSLSGLYGCNMAFRTRCIGTARFDERLPLYGWLEDVDFSHRVAGAGLLGRATGFCGVHRGTVQHRAPGKRLGYSQVANPFYLMRKGTVTPGFCLRQVGRNLIANHVRSVYGAEAWIDRRGRMRGNWSALTDLAFSRLDPERVVHLE